jgi:hypothetical protein
MRDLGAVRGEDRPNRLHSFTAVLAEENECPRAARALHDAGKTLELSDALTPELGEPASTDELAADLAHKLAMTIVPREVPGA